MNEATRFLHNKVIPKFAQKLTLRVACEWDSFKKVEVVNLRKSSTRERGGTVFLADFRLKQYMHVKGINLRHLGRLRNAVAEEVPLHTPGRFDTLQLLLIEMCARTIRRLLFNELRESMSELKVPLEEPYREIYLDYLNKTVQLRPEFFDGPLIKALVIKFGEEALGGEEKEDLSLVKLLQPKKTPTTPTAAPAKLGSKKGSGKEKEDKGKEEPMTSEMYKNHMTNWRVLLVMRLLALTHIKLAPDCLDDLLKELAEDLVIEPLEGIALESVDENVKHLGIIGHSIGYIYKIKAKKTKNHELRERMLHKALKNFEDVLESNPANKITLRNAGDVCTRILCHENRGDKKELASHPLAQKARKYFAHAIRADPDDSYTLFQYAVFFGALGDQNQEIEYFIRAAEADPTHLAAIVALQKCLHLRGFCKDASVMKNVYDHMATLIKAEPRNC